MSDSKLPESLTLFAARGTLGAGVRDPGTETTDFIATVDVSEKLSRHEDGPEILKEMVDRYNDHHSRQSRADDVLERILEADQFLGYIPVELREEAEEVLA